MVARYADQSLSDLARRKALSRSLTQPALSGHHHQTPSSRRCPWPFFKVPVACNFLSTKAGVQRFTDGFALDQLDPCPQRAARRRRNSQRFAAPDDQAVSASRPSGLAARQILRGRQEQSLEAKRMTTLHFMSHENVSALRSRQSKVCWINCGIERRVGAMPILLPKSTAIHRLGLVFEVG